MAAANQAPLAGEVRQALRARADSVNAIIARARGILAKEYGVRLEAAATDLERGKNFIKRLQELYISLETAVTDMQWETTLDRINEHMNSFDRWIKQHRREITAFWTVAAVAKCFEEGARKTLTRQLNDMAVTLERMRKALENLAQRRTPECLQRFGATVSELTTASVVLVAAVSALFLAWFSWTVAQSAKEVLGEFSAAVAKRSERIQSVLDQIQDAARGGRLDELNSRLDRLEIELHQLNDMLRDFAEEYRVSLQVFIRSSIVNI
ncbi:hypothetical protein DFJ73DRAFT_756840 [Zopfochytrium polystomum]|nr:hypothetical protein DFJ73DRAFT_756840 [Zopfochytrium polystomum]